jgi:hypothetical protein
MMKSVILAALLLSASSISTAELTFTRTYPLTGHDSNARIYELPDGGHVVVHRTQQGNLDRFLRLDECGNIVADRFIDPVQRYGFGFAFSVAEMLHDGSQTIVQAYNAGYNSLKVVFRNFDGDSSDCWIVPLLPQMWWNPWPSAICETPNGDIVITGEEDFGSYIDRYVRLDSTGTVRWNSHCLLYMGSPHSITAVDDFTYMVGGDFGLAFTSEDGYSASYLFPYLYGFLPLEHDEGIVCMNHNYNDECCSVFLWTEEAGQIWEYDPPSDCRFTNSYGCIGMDNSIVVCGTWSIPGQSDEHPYIFALSPEGELLWQRLVTEYCGRFDRIVPTSDGGYICSGTIGSFPRGDLLVVKMDSNGKSPPLGIEPEAGTARHGLDLTAYPNPSDQSFTISFTLHEASDANLEIFDITGRLVSSPLEGCLPTGLNGLIAPCLPSGTYLIRLESGGTVETTMQTVL